MRELNESQIKRINKIIKTAGFIGYADPGYITAEIVSFSVPGCNARVYALHRNNLKIEYGHSSLGDNTLRGMKGSIKNITACIKLGQKIETIINE